MWRDKDWVKRRNIFFEQHQPLKPYYKTRQVDYEAGANAAVEVLRELAPEVGVRITNGYIILIPDEENPSQK